ncbi:flagellar biosynthesis protein FlhF [Oceanospirillum maris]|uniref:flagellar biosynthesis protein FlhF n=1 Tax=Oceanospirillum maris TaxID=64977 RepID=UPI0004136CAF|nr:flagellar biosynthesis protein FlhF [Oceanospirillum maris]
MKVKRFFAPDMRQAMKLVRDEFGADAAILSNNKVAGGVEIVTAVDYDASILREPSERIDPENSDALTDSLADALAKAKEVIEQSGKTDQVSNNVGTAFQAKAKERQFSQAEAMVDTLENTHRRSQTPESAAMKAMQSEIQGLRELLREQMKDTLSERKPVEAMLHKRLRRMGLSEHFSARVIEALGLDDDVEFSDAWEKAIEQVRSSVLATGSDVVDQGGIVALMGPTGVGKTTTIGKLAARYVLKYGPDSLALVTTDCYRVAAYEQLRTFGRILGVPVRVVDETHSLDNTLKSLKSKALVLIDTAGLSVQDPNMKEQFSLLEAASVRIRKYLVLGATSQQQVLQSTYDTYRRHGLNGCVVTKLDEAISAGEVVSLIADNRLPLAYIASGQKIPDDLRSGDVGLLVSRALDLLEQQESHQNSER